MSVDRIQPGYADTTGNWRALSGDSRAALVAALGQPSAGTGWRVIEADTETDLGLSGRWSLTREDGGTRTGEGGRIGALPIGIHRLDGGQGTTWLLSAPASLPAPPRSWGVTLPLYALGNDGRIGSYADLAEATESLGRAGADFVGINPVHAGFPTAAGTFSPYSPSHRGRLAQIHVAPSDESALPRSDLLDYASAIPHRLAALGAEFANGRDPAFESWWSARDEALDRFATHQALSERHGPFWTDWPVALRDPDGPAVARAADPERCRFHGWLQFAADRQLARVAEAAEAAGMRHGLYLDLAVGTHPAGAETWGRGDLFARGVSLGAPPDAFSPEGQSWGLAPLNPHALVADGFRAFARILRAQLSHARLLRIDHILGVERAFWVPEGDAAGGYVTMPRDALLAIIRIEAMRAGATIVGEDLGNIPEGLSHALEDSGILGCRIAQFERQGDRFRPAEAYDTAVLTAFASHDLPTWEGWKRGRDIDWRADLDGWSDADRAAAHETRRTEVWLLCEAIGGDNLDALNAHLARTPSRIVAVQIEDLLGWHEQANLPGTIHQHPNWRRRIDVAPGALGSLDAVRRAAIIMADHER